MKAQCSSTHAEETVVERLTHMSLVDRMMLLKKYTRWIESQYRQCRLDEREAIVLKIHRLKFSRRELIEAYENRVAIIDQPRARFYEFLETELGQ
ncbi:MAG TPA: hypothetical protein ACFCUC_06495 [Desulfobacterales bacterium]